VWWALVPPQCRVQPSTGTSQRLLAGSMIARAVLVSQVLRMVTVRCLRGDEARGFPLGGSVSGDTVPRLLPNIVM
jgi:hypothetical protein